MRHNILGKPWKIIESYLKNGLYMRLTLFNRHRLLLGFNCIFRDLSATLVSLLPVEAKETAR